MRIILLVILVAAAGMSVSHHAVADEITTTNFSCGSARISVYNSPAKEAPYFVVRLKAPKGANYHPFLMTRDFFEVRCDTLQDGHPVLLANHICGGSACNEQNYTLIDTDTADKLLESATPEQAAKVLGHQVRLFSCHKFSRGAGIPANEYGEYCFVAAVDLP